MNKDYKATNDIIKAIKKKKSIKYVSYDINTAGITPQDPAVGAATILRIHALDSPILRAFSITIPTKSPHIFLPDLLY